MGVVGAVMADWLAAVCCVCAADRQELSAFIHVVMEDELGRELGMEEDAEERELGRAEAQREAFIAAAEDTTDPSGLLDFVDLHVRSSSPSAPRSGRAVNAYVRLV